MVELVKHYVHHFLNHSENGTNNPHVEKSRCKQDTGTVTVVRSDVNRWLTTSSLNIIITDHTRTTKDKHPVNDTLTKTTLS